MFYLNNCKKKQMNLDIIKNTYIYNDLYQKYGLDFIIDAGYYDNGLNIKLKGDINTINLNEAVKRYDKTKKNAIVYITGSFAPIHDGHIETVIKACETLSNKGYNVIQAIISPDHDKYVVDNKIHRNDLNINKRISLIQEKINNHRLKDDKYPLSCDIWNGLMNSVPINFTELTEMLMETIKDIQKYKDYFNPELFFVCGGDNANFAKAFTLNHGCVIVDRPNHEIKSKKVYNEVLKLNPNAKVFYAKGNNHLSSTEIRKNNYKNITNVKNKSLTLKVEDYEINDLFEKGLFNILTRYYSDIKVLKNEDFYKNWISIINKYKDQNITYWLLDKKFHSYSIKNNLFDNKNLRLLDISRNYTIGGINKIGNSITLQPFIGNKEAILIDDDICSGETIKYAKKYLEELGYNIIEIFNLSKGIYDNGNEILDLSDLIFNSINGGLVIENNYNKIKRYPYILPYVSPYDRASINNPLDFTIDILIWNKEYNKSNFTEDHEYYLNNFLKIKNG